MPIDLSQLSLKATQISQSVQRSTSTQASIAQNLPLVAGEVIQATINKVSAVTEQQLQTLKLQSKNATPSTESAVPKTTFNQAESAQYQKLLTSQTLHLLQVRIKLNNYTLLTDQVLTKGQKVSIFVDNNLQPRLLSKGVLGEFSHKELNYAQTSLRNQATTEPTILKPTIQQALRELLPQHDKPNITSNLMLLRSVITKIPQTPTTLGIQQLLKGIESLALSVDKTPTVTEVKNSLLQSGSLLESRLAKVISPRESTPIKPNDINISNAVKNIGKTVTSTDIKALLIQLTQSLSPGLLRDNKIPIAQPQKIILTEKALESALITPRSVLIDNDSQKPPAHETFLKGSLNLEKPAENPTNQLKIAKQILPPSLLQLLGYTGQVNQPPQNAKTLQTQLVMLVHQLSLSNLAKIRLNQLQPESHKNPHADSGNTSLTFDVPVRHDGALHNAHIQVIQEHENEAAKKAQGQIKKLWQVKLHIVTDVIGSLHIHLRFLDEALSIKFWSDQASTLHEAKQKFSKIKTALLLQGVDVKKIQFKHGAPKNPGNTMAYSLVDIKT